LMTLASDSCSSCPPTFDAPMYDGAMCLVFVRTGASIVTAVSPQPHCVHIITCPSS
jgi:hypothetical protein